MAPEQIRGDVLDGARISSRGRGRVRALGGAASVRGASDALAVMASVLTDQADPEALERAEGAAPGGRVVLRALSKRPEDRFASMEDLMKALDAAARGEAPAEPTRSATEAQSFSTGEVREVLGKAIEQQAAKQGSTKLRFEDLLAVAAEVGVDADSSAEASRALRVRNEAPLRRAPRAAARSRQARRVDPRPQAGVHRHAGVYLDRTARCWCWAWCC